MVMPMKILYIATVQSHICQFHKPIMRLMHEKGAEVHVAACDNLVQKNGLKMEYADKVFDVPFDRSPKSLRNIKAYRQLKKIIDENSYDLIHCNTPVGGVIARLASRRARKYGAKLIYTAHGFHFYKGAPRFNWLVYYPVEKALARLTDAIITITHEDYELARKKFSTNVYFSHGVGANGEKYMPVDTETALELRREMGIGQDEFVILCTGELLKNKNQRTAILAVHEARKKHSDIRLLLAGNGSERAALESLIDELGERKSIELIGYRIDLERYVGACDMVMSCSFREGLPLNIAEAMLMKKAALVSDNRGHRELVENGKTGYIVGSGDVGAFADRLELMHDDRALLSAMGDEAYKRSALYAAENVVKEIEKVYDEVQKV